jgi:hypothetical protein
MTYVIYCYIMNIVSSFYLSGFSSPIKSGSHYSSWKLTESDKKQHYPFTVDNKFPFNTTWGQ